MHFSTKYTLALSIICATNSLFAVTDQDDRKNTGNGNCAPMMYSVQESTAFDDAFAWAEEKFNNGKQRIHNWKVNNGFAQETREEKLQRLAREALETVTEAVQEAAENVDPQLEQAAQDAKDFANDVHEAIKDGWENLDEVIDEHRNLIQRFKELPREKQAAIVVVGGVTIASLVAVIISK